MSTCPACHRTVDTVRGRSRPPVGDDVVVCMTCGAICFFTPALHLRLLLPEDQHRFPATLLLEAIGISNAVITTRSSKTH